MTWKELQGIGPGKGAIVTFLWSSATAEGQKSTLLRREASLMTREKSVTGHVLSMKSR